jgi:hypothetical protein
MLSKQKYAMLNNPYLNMDKCHSLMLDMNAEDILADARTILQRLKEPSDKKVPRLMEPVPVDNSEDDYESFAESFSNIETEHSLDFFLPTKKIYRKDGGIDLHQEMEDEKEEDLLNRMKESHVVLEEGVGDKETTLSGIPESLSVACTRKGHIETYPAPYHEVRREEEKINNK